VLTSFVVDPSTSVEVIVIVLATSSDVTTVMPAPTTSIFPPSLVTPSTLLTISVVIVVAS